MRLAILASVFMALGSSSGSAAALFAFQETGGGVVGTLSGGLDLTGAAPAGRHGQTPGIIPQEAFVSTDASDGVSLDGYLVSGPLQFGTGASSFTGGVASGDSIGLMSSGPYMLLGLHRDYDGGELSATLSFLGESFSSIGAIPGDYVYVLPSQDTLTIRFRNPEPIPLPASLPLLASALAFAGFARRLGPRR